jgi:D-glycero-alpha-D-manno-heptose-7-phosphate kinase
VAAAGDRVVATAPVRVCDVGGWTDTWFGSPGQVCSVAVGPGATVTAELVELGAGAASVALAAPDVPGPHPLLEHAIDAVLEASPLDEGVGLSIEVRSAVPPSASLGTSGAVLVALVGALDALLGGGQRTPADTARFAHEIETGRAGREAGVQDQWAAAMGGAGR